MNPFKNPRRGAPTITALGASALAQTTAQKITEDRILGWHGQCTRELRALWPDMSQEDADQIGMELFKQHCGLQPYLGWPLADEVAKRYDPADDDVDG